jgi:heat shock protein HslJ
MRRTLAAGIVAIGAVVLLAGCGGGGKNETTVVGEIWQWNGLYETHAATVSSVPNPANYLLLLNDDGNFEAKADCNQVHGTYKLSNNHLTLTLGPSTQAACGPNSLSDKYIALLRQVVSQAISDGSLVLGLQRDTGKMFFHAG